MFSLLFPYTNKTGLIEDVFDYLQELFVYVILFSFLNFVDRVENTGCTNFYQAPKYAEFPKIGIGVRSYILYQPTSTRSTDNPSFSSRIFIYYLILKA